MACGLKRTKLFRPGDALEASKMVWKKPSEVVAASWCKALPRLDLWLELQG